MDISSDVNLIKELDKIDISSDVHFMKELGMFFKHCLNTSYFGIANCPPNFIGWPGLFFCPFLTDKKINYSKIVKGIKEEGESQNFEKNLINSMINYKKYMKYLNSYGHFDEVLKRTNLLLEFIRENKKTLKELICSNSEFFPDEKDLICSKSNFPSVEKVEKDDFDEKDDFEYIEKKNEIIVEDWNPFVYERQFKDDFI